VSPHSAELGVRRKGRLRPRRHIGRPYPELLAWTQMLALTGAAHCWEPKRLRLRVFSVAGRLARSGRRLRLWLAERWPWVGEITTGITRLQALPSG
jgi:hypothetical protein